MSSQVFKDRVPVYLLFELLTKICQEQENHLLLSKISFQKAKFHNLLEPFIEKLIPYYHTSKIYYVNRNLDYNKFTTIIRQICRINNISYTSKICYNKSTYDILYYIYKPIN
jgi:hypothetical protein